MVVDLSGFGWVWVDEKGLGWVKGGFGWVRGDLGG